MVILKEKQINEISTTDFFSSFTAKYGDKPFMVKSVSVNTDAVIFECNKAILGYYKKRYETFIIGYANGKLQVFFERPSVTVTTTGFIVREGDTYIIVTIK